jgi:hypothetical protein
VPASHRPLLSLEALLAMLVELLQAMASGSWLGVFFAIGHEYAFSLFEIVMIL